MNLNSIRAYNEIQRARYAAKTGFDVDIEKLGKNTQTIIHEAKPSLEEIRKGVWLQISLLKFPDGNFTNVYDLFWNAKEKYLTPHIHSAKRPFYLFDYFRKDKSALAVINGSFFFLVDVKGKEPRDFPFHFCVRNGVIKGLLSSDEPVVYTKNGVLQAQELRAKGTLKIGKKIISWVGSEHVGSKVGYGATLYNSGSVKILKEFDKKTGVRNGFLDIDHIHTPANPRVVDLVINADKSGNLFVQKIRKNGNTHFFDGLIILQVENDGSYAVGDKVSPLTLDSLTLEGVTSAITIGKGVHDPYFYTPERIASRDARSLIAEDVKGNTHFIVFDGSKYIPRFKGVSANDISEFFSKRKYKWAFFLDGGSSSRILLRNKNKYRFLANDFAFRRIGLDKFLWDSKRHRKLASVIALRVKS